VPVKRRLLFHHYCVVVNSLANRVITVSSPYRAARPARFGLYEVDFRAGELLKDGRKIRLQDQPLQVLQMLLENPGQVVTREEFHQRLWPGDTFVDFDHGLNNAINRLREALNDSADAPRFIETLPRRGYRFVAKVQDESVPEIRATDSKGAPVTTEIPSGATQNTIKPADARKTTSAHLVARRWIAGGLAVAATGLVLAFLAHGRKTGRSPAVNPEAYELYLRAKPYYGLEKKEANDQAIQLLEKSVEVDPQFAAAYAALATAYRTRAFSVDTNDPKWIEKANAAVTRALALDPNLAEGYLARGYLLWSRANDWAYERAVSDYRHALALNPNLAEAHHQLANVYNHVGLLDKADEEIKKAIALDPLNTGIRFRVGINLLYRGKYDEALIELRDSEKFLPPFWAFQTSFAMQHLGRRQEAEDRISRMLKTMSTDPGGSLTSMQALLAADAGDAALAERKIQGAVTKGKGYQHFHHVAYAVASAYALMNKREEALQYLQMAADDGFPCYPLFEHDTNLDHLRSDPGFLSFLAKQKKQWEYFREHL